MADTLSKQKRSWLMSRVRGSNTLPEPLVERFLRQHRIRFRRHDRRLPGTPDIRHCLDYFLFFRFSAQSEYFFSNSGSLIIGRTISATRLASKSHAPPVADGPSSYAYATT
jgi:hypothetical protein